MNLLGKILKILKNPLWIIVFLNNRGFHILNDEKYIKLLYRLNFNKDIDLNEPRTYNEKLQWLKLHDRKDIYTNMVDKYEAKKYVSNIIGEKYIIPTLGIWEKFDDIDFDKLPNEFVLKCTHDSGGVVICKDKRKLNMKQTKKKINKSLKRNFYYSGREWPYKNIKPRIIAEQYMVDESGDQLKDYKFFCFNGEPKLLFVAKDRPTNTKFNYYDMKFEKLPFKQHYENFEDDLILPEGFGKMVELSRKLSKNISHVRVDFYNINGRIYFGELTFYHFSGFQKFEPEEWDKKLGDMLELPKEKKIEK